MAQKTVRWFSCVQLACKKAPNNEVFLYLDSSLVVVPSYHFVQATIVQVVNVRFQGCRNAYCYFFEYDDADTTRELLTEDILEAFCKNSLTQFIQDTAGLGGGGGGGGGVLSAITWIPLTDVVFGDIPAAYAAEALSDVHEKRYINITNYTDQLVFVSFDGVNDHGIVGPNGSSLVLPIAAQLGFEDSEIFLRYGTDAPGSGNVYISAFY